MNIEKLEKLEQNTPLFEKVLLAYWYSIPFDNDRTPDEIKVVSIERDFYSVNLFNKTVNYGSGCFKRYEIENYLKKLKDLDVHKVDIINRLEKEK